MEVEDPLALSYFSGGVPTGEYFRGTLEDIRKISMGDVGPMIGVNRLQELCFVGALSYFEAFCKDHFASLINIEPSLVDQLKAAGQEVTIDGSMVALYGASVQHRLGFLIAEKYDFGTAKKINAFYVALVKVSPFSKDDAQVYSRLLHDRNLLVHHGGTYTMSYLMADDGFDVEKRKDHAFFNSRVVERDDVGVAVDFLGGIGRKLVKATHASLSKYIEGRGTVYGEERKKALGYLRWWGDEPGLGGRAGD
jgi:hypothetical protein